MVIASIGVVSMTLVMRMKTCGYYGSGGVCTAMLSMALELFLVLDSSLVLYNFKRLSSADVNLSAGDAKLFFSPMHVTC